MFKAPLLAAGIACATLALCVSALGEPLIVKADETLLIKMPGTPGTVVVGNPSIADATLEGGNLFVQGKAFGSTNLIVLDQSGNQLGNFSITVQMGGDNNLALYGGGLRRSYACAPLCEAVMQVGDDNTFIKDTLGRNEEKANFAKGISNQDNAQQSSGGGGGNGQ